MGKEWQFWCAAGGGGGRREAGSTSGCLSVVYQLFDFNRQVPPSFSSSPTSFKQEDKPPINDKGIEAPRNSLEMDASNFLQAPFISSAMKMEDNLHIPMGIQIKTRVDTMRSTTSDYSSSPDYLTSPSVKTPTLVARLMGLDLLPDTSSTSPSHSSRSSNSKPPSKSPLKYQNFSRKDKILTGARSLPETPRASSARKSDVDRRLSLQSSRDSVDRVGEIELSGRSRIRIVKREVREDDEVQERVKKIKEGVSRRFGVEITNRVKNRGFENRGVENRGNESEIVVLKANRPVIISEELGPSKYSMKLLEKEKINQRILNRNFKKNVIKNKHNEPFVRSNLGKDRKGELVIEKRCKRKTRNSNASSVLSVKKEPSFPPTKLPPKQQKQSQVSNSLSSKSITQLSSSLSHKYRQVPEDRSTVQCTISDRSNGCAFSTFAAHQLLEYIKDILFHKNICINTPLSITMLPFMSLNIDPLIFNQLETSHSHFSLGCNRKLVFELVHEILGDVFRPFTEFKPWGKMKWKDFEISGTELIEMLREKIDGFPLANCQNLEDIDSLIEGDLASIELKSLGAFDDDGEAVVEEIGVELLEMIVQEVAMDFI